MLPFSQYEVPVAYAMISMARRISEVHYEPFQEYMSYWTAFNNIYTTIADFNGLRPTFEIVDGVKRTRSQWGYTFPTVRPVSEVAQIQAAIKQIPSEVSHQLIVSENTKFFVYRKLRGLFTDVDSIGQKMNGVLNITRTISKEFPVWSPIDTQIYEDYVAGNRLPKSLEVLTEQIVFLLYTVRNNLFHGGKRVDDARDRSVVEHALPLLKLLVETFIDLEHVSRT
jgi:hypothetical protein